MLFPAFQKNKNPLTYWKIGAEEKTRTSTRSPPHEPESCASTSSATSAPYIQIVTKAYQIFYNFFYNFWPILSQFSGDYFSSKTSCLTAIFNTINFNPQSTPKITLFYQGRLVGILAFDWCGDFYVLKSYIFRTYITEYCFILLGLWNSRECPGWFICNQKSGE